MSGARRCRGDHAPASDLIQRDTRVGSLFGSDAPYRPVPGFRTWSGEWRRDRWFSAPVVSAGGPWAGRFCQTWSRRWLDPASGDISGQPVASLDFGVLGACIKPWRRGRCITTDQVALISSAWRLTSVRRSGVSTWHAKRGRLRRTPVTASQNRGFRRHNHPSGAHSLTPNRRTTTAASGPPDAQMVGTPSGHISSQP